jgi:exopolysaccharide biosynthesis protein
MKKLLALMLVLVIIMTMLPFTVNASTIYESSTKENIASGITHQTIVTFTDKGWLNINVLKVDLTNQYINIDTLSSDVSLKNLVTVKTLAQDKGAVAAINGGFFNWLGNSGFPDGTIVKNGEVITAANEYNRYGDNMATFAIDNSNHAMFDYWKTDINLVAPNGKSQVVMQYNKLSVMNYDDLIVLDRKWNSYSIGATNDMPDMVEMTVQKGKVLEIRQGKPATPIPENGYVIISRQSGAGQFLVDNFNPGDSAALDIKTNPDWTKIKMAVTGGAVLVKDGQIPQQFSSNISGSQPRTAVGCTKDGKQLIMATVDGRQVKSIGMTQAELAQFMIEMGAYNAINLDGGGSTTMVDRPLGNSSLSVVNSPSDGGARGISTAVGIFSSAPSTQLAGLIITTEDKNVFVNTSRKYTVKGYDTNYNPVNIDQNSVKWSVSGIQGSFVGNTLYSKSVGTGYVKATINGISQTFEVNSLSAPVQLYLSDKKFKISSGDTKTLSVSGRNKNGYSAVIYPSDVKWTVKGNIGTVTNGTFKAANKGSGYLDAYIGNAHAYCGVSIVSTNYVLKDKFETLNGSFLSSPADLPGSYEISTEQKRSGNSSGKLTFDFTNLEGTRAAYMLLSDNGLTLDSNTSAIGLWVYNPQPSSNMLRAEVYDKNNTKHLVDFSRDMDWTGWKYVEAYVADINPSRLTRIYLAQPSPVSSVGSVYFDDLSVALTTSPAVSSLPSDTIPSDADNKAATYKSASDSFRFSVFGQSRDTMNAYEKTLLSGFTNKINKYIDVAAVVGSNKHEFASQIKKPLVSTDTGYKSFDYKGSRFIQLDISKSGLRESASGQWNWFKSQLDSAKGNNVFIFMEYTPSGFSDISEAKLFKDTLTNYKQSTGKNIIVFYKGSNESSYMDRGIKYISTAGLDSASALTSGSKNPKYILVTVKGSTVTYQFKSI